MKINERVRFVRLMKGIKQNYVAQQIGLSVANYNAIEGGRIALKADLIPPIAEALGVKPCIFFTDDLNETLKSSSGNQHS